MSKNLSQSYHDYIESDAWRRRRALKLFLAGGSSGRVQCEICRGVFSVRRVDVHHATYDRFGAEPLDDLRVLCRECHEQVKEIADANNGGPMDAIGWSLLERLAAIDNRLLPKPPTVGPILDSAVPRPDVSLGELIAIINKKRLSCGLAPYSTPDDF